MWKLLVLFIIGSSYTFSHWRSPNQKYYLTNCRYTDFTQMSLSNQYSSSWGIILAYSHHFGCGIEILVNYCWEQQKIKKINRQVGEVVTRCFSSHSRCLKRPRWRIVLPRTIFLSVFCLCFPGERERKNPPVPCTRLPHLPAGSGSAVNTTRGTLRIRFIAQHRVRLTYEASFMAGAAVVELNT